MDNKEPEVYEDIKFDIKDEDNCEDIEESEDNSEERNELEVIVNQLTNDYSNYFKFDINSEKKETEDAIEDLLTHLEEFCGLIEMIRNDNNICVEEVVKRITEKSKVMDQLYLKIDKLEKFIEVVTKCVDEMDNELTKAEQLFGDNNNNNNKVKKFLSFITNNSKKQLNCRQIDVKYEPKDIFRTSDYIKTCDLELVSQPLDPNSDQTINASNGSTSS